MSSIDFINKIIVWTDNNYLDMSDEWVKTLKKQGYILIDNRKQK